jgi:hypothetical protein
MKPLLILLLTAATLSATPQAVVFDAVHDIGISPYHSLICAPSCVTPLRFNTLQISKVTFLFNGKVIFQKNANILDISVELN